MIASNKQPSSVTNYSEQMFTLHGRKISNGDYHRITANLDCTTILEKRQEIKTKLLAEITELQKEKEVVKLGPEKKERRWRLTENLNKRIKRKEKKEG